MERLRNPKIAAQLDEAQAQVFVEALEGARGWFVRGARKFLDDVESFRTRLHFLFDFLVDEFNAADWVACEHDSFSSYFQSVKSLAPNAQRLVVLFRRACENEVFLDGERRLTLASQTLSYLLHQT